MNNLAQKISGSDSIAFYPKGKISEKLVDWERGNAIPSRY